FRRGEGDFAASAPPIRPDPVYSAREAEMSKAWDPAQYERFRDERSRPFFDLLAMVRPRPGMRVADLGCGTGELTQHLHNALQAQETVGIDSSETMLARSWEFAGDGLRFAQEDIEGFSAR